MNKEEVLQRMNIDSIVELVNLIENEKDITELSAQIVAEDGKKVKVEKSESGLTITLDDAPKLIVSSVPTAYNPYEKRDVTITYQFADGNLIQFTGTGDYTLEGIDKEDLVDDLKITYVSNGLSKTTRFNWFLIPNGIQIDEEGIKYHNMLLSFDGKEIKKINDEEVPSKKDLESFDFEEEKEKVNAFLNGPVALNGVTKRYIEDTMSQLEKKKDYLAKSLKDYEVVTDRVSSLVQTREEFVGHLGEIDFRSYYLGFARDWVAEFSKTRRYDKTALVGRAKKKTMNNNPQE